MNKQTSQNFADLQKEVADVVNTERSALTLINGFSARLDAAIEAAANGDTDALPQLAADLKSSSDSLAAAVIANTPAAE